jgi:hypothetical protein
MYSRSELMLDTSNVSFILITEGDKKKHRVLQRPIDRKGEKRTII